MVSEAYLFQPNYLRNHIIFWDEQAIHFQKADRRATDGRKQGKENNLRDFDIENRELEKNKDISY